MKKNLFYLFALICSMGLLASCDDDDDNDYSGVITNELAGKYKGTLSITVDGQTVSTGNLQQVTVERGANSSSITLSLSDFSFSNLEIGDVSIENCVLVENGSSYTFSGTTSLSVSILTADVNATGVIGNGSLSIDMEIDALLGGVEQAVTVTYSGTKLSGTEGTEADIVSFTFDEDVVATQPVINGTTITFNVLEGVDVTSLTPTIEVSAGATITPASGVAQNFSSPVTYTVVSEDYGTTKTYTVSVNGTSIYYDFEEWTVDTSQSNVSYQYPIVSGWASSNQSLMLIKSMGALFGISQDSLALLNSWPVSSTTDAYEGSYAVCIESLNTFGGSRGSLQIPKVTAATLFLGSFNAYAALNDPMTTTSFGVVFTQKPLEVKGYYKYTPGTEFYNASGELQSGVVDEYALSAVLYEVDSASETLDGSNIYTSDKIVAMYQLTGGTQEEYTAFSLPLEYTKEYDAEKMYKLAVIFSASKDGASYNAAIGSKLIIDSVEIVCE